MTGDPPAAGQAAEQIRALREIHAAELAAARHERDAAMAETRWQAWGAAEIARDRDQLRRSSQAQIAMFEDTLGGLRALAEHAGTNHARILGERDQAQAELARFRAAATAALAACERAIGSTGSARISALIEEAAAALRAVTGVPPLTQPAGACSS